MADEEIDLDAEPTYHAVPPPRRASDAGADAEATAGPEAPAEPPRKKSAAELRLEAIRAKLGEARNSNHKAVVDEDRRSKMTEKQLRDEERRARDQRDKRGRRAAGDDAEDVLYAITAEEADEAVEKAEEKRRRVGAHAWDIAEQSLQLGSRMKNEAALIESGAIAAAAGAQAEIDPLGYGTAAVYKPSEERVDALVNDLAAQAARRASSSRRRQHYEEDEVSYINDRNKVFNEKLSREFAKYTSEIKNNLERGTAL